MTTTTIIARFTVDDATPLQVPGIEPDSSGADWVGVMRFTKTFTTGIVGSATTLFMSAGTVEGSRSYVATEHISGRTDDGGEGTFTVQHGGLESDPETWFGHIVPNTGTGDFASWTGLARIAHDDQGAFLEIDLDED